MQLLLTSVGTAQWVEGSHLPYLSCLEIAGSAAPGVPAPSSHPHRPQAHPSICPVPVCHALHVALLLALTHFGWIPPRFRSIPNIRGAKGRHGGDRLLHAKHVVKG